MHERANREPYSAEHESRGRGHHAAGNSLFTERIDRFTSAVVASGRLDSRSADMLGGTVEVMSRRGHGRVTLDLGGVTADGDIGLRAMRSLEARLDAVGAHVSVRPQTGRGDFQQPST